MLTQISDSIARLSAAERRVAGWVVAHPRQAAESTLAEVAREVGVSEPTVVRFCRSVGLGGFRELTLRLAEALSQPDNYLHQEVTLKDNPRDAVDKVFESSISALVSSRTRLGGQPFDEATHMLAEARQIAFAGLGASGHVAADACHKFFRLGIPCTALADSPGILQFAAIAQAGDVMLFVSTRGAWSELARAARQARDRGAAVISITRRDSELARHSNLLIANETVEDTSVFTPMTSRLTQLALLDALQVTLALAGGEAALERLRASKAAIG